MTTLFYSYHIFIVLLYGFSSCKSEEMLSNPYRGPKERTGLFSSIQDYAMSLVFKKLHVTNKFGCLSKCLDEPSCHSVNYDTTGYPNKLCELSRHTFDSRSLCKTPRPGFVYYFPLQTAPVHPSDPCINVTCKNGATCELACNEQGYRCKCGKFNKGDYCQLWTVNVSSCLDIFNNTSYRSNMAYTYMIDNKQTDIYCHLSSDLCGSKGWTLAIKTDGSKNTFIYSSSLWSNKNPYQPIAGKTGFDNHETKMPSYWGMPFKSLCVGLKVNNNLNWAVIPYKASSLYDVIADGTSRSFTIGRNKWLSLIDGSSLQPNCNAEGFNVLSIRIGIRSNQENDCRTPDSAIGFGFPWNGLTCGNHCRLNCNNGEKNVNAFGYILVK